MSLVYQSTSVLTSPHELSQMTSVLTYQRSIKGLEPSRLDFFLTRYCGEEQLALRCGSNRQFSVKQTISKYVRTVVLGTDNSSWLVYFLSTLVPQYSVWTTHHRLFFSQYVSTVVLGTVNSSRLVYFLVSQYCSTRYGQLITACLFLSTLVLQYSVWTTHHGLFISLEHQYHSTRYRQLITACLFPQYVSTVVLFTDNSSRLVYFLSTLVPQYSVRTTHHGLFISQYVSTVVLGKDNSSRLVYLLVRQYFSTRYGQLITTCLFLSTLVLQYSVQTLITACLLPRPAKGWTRL